MHRLIVRLCCNTIPPAHHKTHESNTLNNTLLYAITVLIWGSTWFAIEFQLGVVEPEVSVAYRYLGAAALLFILCKIKGLPLLFNVDSHKKFALMGLLMFCLNYILAYRAQVHITSALAAIAFSSMVWMNIVNARLFFGVRVGLRTYLGALLGIVGILVLFAPELVGVSLSGQFLFGMTIALAGALMASFGNMVAQSAQSLKLPVMQSNAWSMFYGAVFTSAIALMQGHSFAFDTSPSYVVSLAYLTIFGSVIAFGAYLTLLGRIGAHKAGYAAVMFPVVAILLSTLFEGLDLTPTLVIGTLLVLMGNYFVLTFSRRDVKRGSEG